jgi:hypothetical protein
VASKYSPLETYLRELPSAQVEVTMSFVQIERIINDTLPPSAYQYQAWWANEKDPHQPEKQAILNAGWRVDTINLKEKWIRFIKQSYG